MKLLILGASGGVGSWVVKLAAERGHQMVAVVRAESAYAPPDGVRVIRADVSDAATIPVVMFADEFDAVVSCVGIRRKHPANPWSKVLSPPDLTQRVAAQLVDCMPDVGIRRLIAVSAGGVGDSRTHMSRLNRWLFDHSQVGIAYADLHKMEATLAGSNLDWLAVRPATLTNGKLTGRARRIDFYGVMSRISRADVAAWMLDQLESPITDRTPMIAA
jgi:putative NADH-flavin reductase